MQHRTAPPTFSREEERLCRHDGWPSECTGDWKLDSLERGIVLDRVGSIAARYLPDVFAFVHVDRGDAIVGRLHQRQSLHTRHRATAPAHVAHVGVYAVALECEVRGVRERSHVKDSSFGIERTVL